jgi:hypothetical protein
MMFSLDGELLGVSAAGDQTNENSSLHGDLPDLPKEDAVIPWREGVETNETMKG